jgi:hypothetical protein
MKKLLFIAVLAITIAGCKKESMSPAVPESGVRSLEAQVAELISKGDPELYDKIYNRNPNSKEPVPDVHITHGIFVPQGGDIASGTCYPNPNCVCHITLTWPAFVTDSTEETIVTSNYYVEFTEAGEGEIIMNDSIPYSIHDLESVDIRFGELGRSTVVCKELE